MDKQTTMGKAAVSKDEALAVIGKVWAGNVGDEVWRLFEAGDYAAARDIAARKVAEQDQKSVDNQSRTDMTDEADQTTVTFTADQIGALRALLRLVHYDNLAQDWFDALPAEIREDVQAH